jgi:hypothetical protein
MSQVTVAPHAIPTAPMPGAERLERFLAAAAGIAGALLLVAYFAAPAFLAWPYAGATPESIVQYADAHAALFYGGAWLQVTGTLLCVVLFLALVRQSGAALALDGMVTSLAAAVLLATVVIEAAFLVAVPMAASAGDGGTASSMFTLSNGVFLRVFPLAPASATLIALGLVLRRSNLLGAPLAAIALGLGIAFELAGIAAIAVPGALAALAILSAGQALWVVAAGVRLGTAAPTRDPGAGAAA